MTFVVGALGVALTSSAAFAEESLDGTISKIDPETRTLTLVSGESFTLPGTYELADLEVGRVVNVRYEVEGGQNVVTSIMPRGAGATDNNDGASETVDQGSGANDAPADGASDTGTGSGGGDNTTGGSDSTSGGSGGASGNGTGSGGDDNTTGGSSGGSSN
jgi:hypothetical protein